MLDQILKALTDAGLLLDQVPVGVAATVAAVVLEVCLRVLKTDKPRSLIRLVSVFAKGAAVVCGVLEKLLLKIAGLVDAVVPDRVKEPAEVIPLK